METTMWGLEYILGFTGIMEKKMETTMWGLEYILGLYRDNGKENGNYYLGFRVDDQITASPRLHRILDNRKEN